MKNTLLISVAAFIAALGCEAQERINGKPASLSYKSKEVKHALFWRKNSETGQWESRKNSKLGKTSCGSDFIRPLPKIR